MKALWILQTFAEIAILVRLVRGRLLPGHRAFAAWLAGEVVRSLLLVSLPLDSPLYRSAWRAWALPLMFLQVLTVLEFVSRCLADYPGISRFVPRLLISLAGVSAMVVLVSSPPDLAYVRSGAWLVIGQRYLATALAVVAATLLLFLGTVAPSAARRRNVIRHGGLLVAYFGIVAAGYLVHLATNGAARDGVNLVVAIGATLCFTAWCLALTPEGEVTPEVIAQPGAEAARGRLIEFARRADRVWRKRP